MKYIIFDIGNKNFKKGLTIFQICLMISMILGAIINNQTLILFSTFMCVAGYLEPNQERYKILESEE